MRLACFFKKKTSLLEYFHIERNIKIPAVIKEMLIRIKEILIRKHS